MTHLPLAPTAAGCSSLPSRTLAHAVSCQPQLKKQWVHGTAGQSVQIAGIRHLCTPPLQVSTATPSHPSPATPLYHPAVFQFLVAAARILLWRRWERLDRQTAMPRSRAALAASTVLAMAQEAAPNGLKEGSGKVVEPAAADDLPPGDARAAVDAAAAAAAAAAGQAEQGAAASGSAGTASAVGGDSPATASGSKRRAHSLQKLKSRARFVWRWQPADIHELGATGWLMELAICMTQALWPNLGALTVPLAAWRTVHWQLGAACLWLLGVLCPGCLATPGSVRDSLCEAACCAGSLQPNNTSECKSPPPFCYSPAAVTRHNFVLMRRAWLAAGAKK